MPADRDQSPRAAIQEWLSRTEHGAESSEPQRTSHLPTRRSKTERSFHRSQQLSATIPGVDRHSHVRPLRASAKDRVSHEHHSRVSGRHEVNLAERLGLHAPFRTFEDDDGAGELGHGTDVAAHRKTKRRRTVSSSSLLEPAEINPGLGGEDAEDEGPCNPRARTRGYSFHDGGINGSESGSKPSNCPTTKPKSYERRPRHKTRENRYESKQDGKRPAKKPKKTGTAGKDRKRVRSKKSGNTLMHDFTASNVAQDRLTIKPATSLGLFSKGRASSPVRRKGLPDLTFSEMTFLNSRSKQPKATERHAAEKSRRQKKDKTEDTEAAISRYFTSKGLNANPGPETAERADLAGVGLLPEDKHDVRGLPSSSLPPVELPGRPFLGFGSSGASLTSPTKPGKHCGTPHGKARPSSENKSVADSTSYYTWSRSAHSAPHAPTPTHHHRSGSLHTGLASPECVQASRLERTSIAPPDDALPERADHGSMRSASWGEHARTKDVIHRETPNHRARSDCKEPVPPAMNSEGAYATAAISDADAVNSDRAVLDQSSGKHVPKEENAQNRPHSEAQSIERNPLVTNLACKTPRSSDSALEHRLHAGQNVFRSSAPPRNAIDVAVQRRAAVENEDGTSATPTIRSSQREDTTTSDRAYQSSIARRYYQGPSAAAPNQPTHAYPQGHQCRDAAYPTVTQLTVPRIIHEPMNPRSHASTAIEFSRSSESRAQSGGAWNAYQYLYQTQLMAISDDNHRSEDRLRGFESWGGEASLDRHAPFLEVPYLGVEIPDTWERTPDRFSEDNDPEQIVCDEATFASPSEQSIPMKNEGPLFGGMVSNAGVNWFTRDNAFDPFNNAPASSAQQHIVDMSETTSIFANPGPMATTFTTLPTYTTEARSMGERTEFHSHDHLGDWNEGANSRNSHLAVGQNGHLSNFWRPNRLY